jgi:hypothetical protein
MPVARNLQSRRAKEFFHRYFQPCSESLRKAAQQTPLVIMLWGPRQRTKVWSSKRQEIRDELLSRGHAVFFSEQLGIPISAVTQKGVQFLQKEAADLIVCMQSCYAAIGSVHHFVGRHVIDSKMVLFVDQAAPDAYIYQRVLAELRYDYNNVETYSFPDDIIQDRLFERIQTKATVLQMVKYRSRQRGRSWGLKFEDGGLGTTNANPLLQPFSHNLLELYHEHRDEIDVLIDPLALYILAFVNQVGRISLRMLQQELGLTNAILRGKLISLCRGEMLLQSDGELVVGGFGKRLLEGLGLCVPSAPAILAASMGMHVVRQPRSNALKRRPQHISPLKATLSIAATMMIVAVGLYWSNTTENQLPLMYAPTKPIVAQTTTPTPILPVVATPLAR